ncbi:MAG: iron chelate uptake ABC transporter family permease subunit [Symbiopectobacterium sp.]|uniref:iron chelate uptake ABC transporter family permease subunit n=1 Tax=Symbiopectobacterium sp. TaxID=2952789 RepID=UPI0039E7877C
MLRNPLAEPATLGIATGAQLGVTVATLWALPGGDATQQWMAMAGALGIGVLVFGLSWGETNVADYAAVSGFGAEFLLCCRQSTAGAVSP